LVYPAYERVKANHGAAGVDGQSLVQFEEDLDNHWDTLWNRLSSGSYFPPPVKAVEIPKKAGSVRILGVPTVADRIAQTVVTLTFEPLVEPIFHPDSYGYRPGRSALDALAQTRQRCWHYDWVLEFDIQGLFDHIPHDLLMKAVRQLFWLTPFVYGLAKSVVISSSLIPRLHWWSGNSPRWYSQHSLMGVGSGFSGELYSQYWWCVNQRIPALWADLDFTSSPDPWGI